MTLGYILSWLVELYSFVIIAWVIASWIPNARRYAPVRLLGRASEPLLSRARRIIPPVGGFDVSPIAVILLLQLLAGFLRGLPL